MGREFLLSCRKKVIQISRVFIYRRGQTSYNNCYRDFNSQFINGNRLEQFSIFLGVWFFEYFFINIFVFYFLLYRGVDTLSSIINYGGLLTHFFIDGVVDLPLSLAVCIDGLCMICIMYKCLFLFLIIFFLLNLVVYDLLLLLVDKSVTAWIWTISQLINISLT